VPTLFSVASLQHHQQLIADSREQLVQDVQYLTGVLWAHAKVGLEFNPTVDAPREGADPLSAWLVRLGPADNDIVNIMLVEGIDTPAADPDADGTVQEGSA